MDGSIKMNTKCDGRIKMAGGLRAKSNRGLGNFLSMLVVFVVLALVGKSGTGVIGADDKSTWEYNSMEGASNSTSDCIEFVKYGFHPSMAIDENGQIHLAFYASNLDYGKRDSISWSFEDVETDDTSPRGQNSSICLDSQGKPHIVYPGRISHTSSYQFMYACRDDGNWQLAEVDVVGDDIFQTSLGITKTGQMWASWGCIPYYNASTSACELRYSHFDGEGWTTGLIDQGNRVGMKNSLVLDQVTGNPRVALFFGSIQK